MRYLLYLVILPLVAVAMVAKCIETVAEGIFDLCAWATEALHPHLPDL